MRYRSMSHHDTATFFYKFIEAKKHINEINSNAEYFKKSHFFLLLVTKENERLAD